MDNSIYEVPAGLCGEDMCPGLDCWVCIKSSIEDDNTDPVCGCGSELCSICNLDLKGDEKYED